MDISIFFIPYFLYIGYNTTAAIAVVQFGFAIIEAFFIASEFTNDRRMIFGYQNRDDGSGFFDESILTLKHTGTNTRRVGINNKLPE